MNEGKPEKLRKCVKIKHPCKICATTVHQKTGLQCNGACKKWMHYSCLEYTPGKIQDIKDGFIKIICPCPDCEGTGPKEEKVLKPPYQCAKSCCPQIESPTCDSPECAANKNQTEKQNMYEVPPAYAPQNPNMYLPQYGPPPMRLSLNMQPPVQPCQPNHLAGYQQPYNNQQYIIPPVANQPNSCLHQHQTPTAQEIKPLHQQAEAQTSIPISKLPVPNKQDQCTETPPYAIPANESKSCSCMSNDSRYKDKSADKVSLKDRGQSATSMKEGPLNTNLEEMCKTVGELATQVKDLMCKLTKQNEETKEKN